jgi:hypothetical protein
MLGFLSMLSCKYRIVGDPQLSLITLSALVFAALADWSLSNFDHYRAAEVARLIAGRFVSSTGT